MPNPRPTKRRTASLPERTIDEISKELFTTAFKDLQEPLFRYLFTLLGNTSEVEDIAQECFLRLNREFTAHKRIENVKAWLFRTGHNLAIDHHRHRRRCSEDRLDYFAMQVADKRQSSPELMLECERIAVIRAAMDTLSGQQRACLRLRAEGLRHKEISGILGIGEGTVCEHIRRGLARLRTKVQASI
jgi:RNA polymerase sigma-70 factor, ECF subfamily